MTDTQRHDAGMRWLARNVAWSRRIESYRDPAPRGPVLVTLVGFDRDECRDERRHDRVA
jgi:hypothetical protein